MSIGGIMWFWYMLNRMEHRFAENAKSVTKYYLEDTTIPSTAGDRSQTALTLLSKRNANEANDMLYPFLLTVFGCWLMTAGQRKSAEQGAAGNPLPAE